jgi:hypothetical protein
MQWSRASDDEAHQSSQTRLSEAIPTSVFATERQIADALNGSNGAARSPDCSFRSSLTVLFLTLDR